MVNYFLSLHLPFRCARLISDYINSAVQIWLTRTKLLTYISQNAIKTNDRNYIFFIMGLLETRRVMLWKNRDYEMLLDAC